MIEDLKPYPYKEDKPSGVEWSGEVPRGWKFLRGKAVFSIIDKRSETGKEEL